MPKWVNNWIGISGTTEEIEQFQAFISERPRLRSENENFTPGSSFSFHSFITPDESITYDEYHGVHGTSPDGKGGIERQGDTAGNWYNWNNSNWDTKWDACYVNVERYDDKNSNSSSINIQFETAWAPPIPIFDAICRQFPKLSIDFEWEEEQGFGAKGCSTQDKDGASYTETESWDIPGSHADHEARDRSCICEHTSDVGEWYDDCPRETANSYVIEQVVTFKVVANTDDIATAAVNSELNGFDLPEGVKVVSDFTPKLRIVEKEEIANV